MTDRWQQVKRIFLDAIARPRGKRAAFLDAECGEDEELRREVEALLEGHDSGSHPASLQRLAASPSLAGTELGGYRLDEEVGGGAMGIVYRATHLESGDTVAVKVLRQGLALSPIQLQRFEREATATRAIDHPGVIRVLDFQETGGQIFFAMDYIEGTTLAHRIEEWRAGERPSTATVLEIIATVAEALHAAHAHGVIHRDVKPQNILLDEDGQPHLVDFGLAKFAELSGLTRSGDIAGTPYYMSPEQALAKRVRVDHRTDVFSLGVVLYETLALHRPFEGESQQDVLYAITFQVPAPLSSCAPQIPSELETICQRALAKSPGQRYATAADFAGDLRRVLAKRPILARPPSWRTRAADRLRPHRREVLIGGAALAIGGAFFLGRELWTPSPPTHPPFRIATAIPGARVTARAVDFYGRPTGSPIDLGVTPVDILGLPAQRHSFRVERDGSFVDLTLDVHEFRDLEVTLRSTADVERGMVPVPGGEFLFGYGRKSDRNPYWARIEPVEPFLIDPAEVTNAEYRQFCKATDRKEPELWCGRYDEVWDDLPVAGVTWQDARAFATRAGKRLPTTLEWQRATRGTSGWEYPWGPDAEPMLQVAVLDHKPAIEDPRVPQWPPRLKAYLAAVKPARSAAHRWGPLGLHHTLGNVGEWTDSYWFTFRPEARPDPGRTLTVGRSWPRARTSSTLYMTTSVEPGTAHPHIGFRCVRSASS